MNAKKTIIFSVNDTNQIYSEFTLNTTITFLKSYFRDVTGISDFCFVYNGKIISNDQLQIRNLLNKNSSAKTLILQVVVNNEMNNKGVLMKNSSFDTKLNTSSFLTVKEENETLRKRDKDNGYKIRGLTEEYNTLKKERDVLSKQIEDMINEKKLVDEKIASARSMILALTEENKELRQVNENVLKEKEELREIMTKRKTKAYNNQISFTIDAIYNKVETNTTTKTEGVKEEMVQANLIDIIEGNGVKSHLYQINQINSSEIQSIEVFIQDEPMNSNTITNLNKEEEAKPLLTLTKRKSNTNPIESSIWKYISSFLSIQEQMIYSLTSKANRYLTFNIWLEILSSKISSMDNALQNTIKQYTLLFTDINQFAISKFSKSALMILNNKTHSQMFIEEQIPQFKGSMQICMYQIFAQITQILPYDPNMTKDDFTLRLIIIFKEGIANHKGLGEYLKICLQRLDLSFNNILTVYQIMKLHGITSIDSSDISKDNKTSGIISFLVKDILFFCGIEEDSKHNTNTERFNTFNEIKKTLEIIDNKNRIHTKLSNKINKKSNWGLIE